MTRTFLSLALATLVLGGCAGGLAMERESPTRLGVHLYGAPGFQLGESDRTTVHPLLGYSYIEGTNLWALGGQFRQAMAAADDRLWVGGEGSYLRIGGQNGWSVGGLAGYQLTGFSWPASAYLYLGYLSAFGTGLYGRIGVEVQPPQLMDLIPR